MIARDDGETTGVICSFLDRNSGHGCFETATHRTMLRNRQGNAGTMLPDKEDYACEKHTKWLVDSGVVQPDDVTKL